MTKCQFAELLICHCQYGWFASMENVYGTTYCCRVYYGA